MPEPKGTDDLVEEALQRLAQNRSDDEAFRALYTSLWPYVYTIAYRTLKADGDRARDVGQDVFIRVHRYCPYEALRDAGKLRAYVRVITLNVIRSQRRGLGLGTVAAQARAGEAAVEAAEAHERGSEPAEAADLMGGLLAWLPEKDRELLSLKFEGFTIGEIAARLGLTYSAVAVRLFRLRGKVRKFMENQGL